LAETLAEQPEWIIEKLASRTQGLTMRHPEFPPSVGQVVKMASDLQAKVGEEQERAKRIQQQFAERRALPRTKEPFRPFPKLWEAFADEPDLLDPQKNYLTFDRLFDASKALATRGKDAARTILEIRR